MYISLYDLGLFILFVVFVIACLYAIVVLRRLLTTLKLVNGILSENRTDIGKTVALVQSTLVNINGLSEKIKEFTDKTEQSYNSLPLELIESVGDLRENIEVISLYVKLVFDSVKAVFGGKDQ